MREPKPHQTPIIEWLKNRDKAVLACDMRTGKSHMTAHWLTARPFLERILIVAPISSHGGWIESLELDGLHPILLEGSRDEKCKQLTEVKRGLFIVNGEGIYQSERDARTGKTHAIPNEVALFPWDAVIYDEFVTLANPKNKCNIIAQAHLARAKHKLMLSGDFAPEGSHQVFEPMRFLNGQFMGHRNFWRWRADYFYQNGFEWTPKDVHGIRKEWAKYAYVLSRKDAGMEETKTQDRRFCVLPQAIRSEYERIQKNLAVDLNGTILCEVCHTKGWITVDDIEELCTRCWGEGQLSARQTNLLMVTLNWLSQIAGGYPKDFPALHSNHKSNLLLEVLEEHSKKPVVVSYRYNNELYACGEILMRKKIRTAIITGDTPVAQRAAHVRAWANAKRPYPLLIQAAVGAYGLNLAASDVLIRYSLPYSYNLYSQGASRIFNMNKTNDLLYVDLLCKGTVDEAALDSLMLKKSSARLFMEKFKERVFKNMRLSV